MTWAPGSTTWRINSARAKRHAPPVLLHDPLKCLPGWLLFQQALSQDWSYA